MTTRNKLKPQFTLQLLTLLTTVFLISSSLTAPALRTAKIENKIENKNLASFLETARQQEHNALVHRVQQMKNLAILAQKKKETTKPLYGDSEGNLVFPSRLKRYVKHLTGSENLKQLEPNQLVTKVLKNSSKHGKKTSKMNSKQFKEKYGIVNDSYTPKKTSLTKKRNQLIKRTHKDYYLNKYGGQALGKPSSPSHHLTHKILA